MEILFYTGTHTAQGFQWEPCLVTHHKSMYGLHALASNFNLKAETLHQFLVHLSALMPVQKDLLDAIDKPETARMPGRSVSVISPKQIIELLRTFARAKSNNLLYKSELEHGEKAASLLPHLSSEFLLKYCEATTGFTLFKQNHKKVLAQYLETEANRKIYRWIEAFPDHFLETIFQLFNWRWQYLNEQPEEVGQKIINIVFSRLQTDTYEELLATTPKRKYAKNGIPGAVLPTEKLLEHLISVTNIVKLSKGSIEIFFQLLNQLEPVHHQYLVIPIKKKKQDIPKDILPVCEWLKTAL